MADGLRYESMLRLGCFFAVLLAMLWWEWRQPRRMILSLPCTQRWPANLGMVLALGAPPVAVLLFEVILNAAAMFNHGNVALPKRLDRRLRWIVVTSDMHRVHHSVRVEETNSNFGFNLPWWDRLFGTCRDQPQDGHTGMTIGLEYCRDWQATRLDGLLIQPFLRRSGE